MIKYPILFFSILFLFINLLGCQQKGSTPKNQNIVEEASDSIIQKNNAFIPPKIPEFILFAGENIPLKTIDIREALDRELVVNNFWHSNTFFYFKRANRWFPAMEKILKDEGVPTDFLYLAVIESGLTQATSPSGAKGFWQFMPNTAKDYGLEVSINIDERMHVSKSTRAACKYLKKAHSKLGSWVLAAAAYNRGVTGINNALEAQKVDNFFDLNLNEETSRYVFRILALKLIMQSPKKYGFYLKKDDLYPPFKTKTITVSKTIPDLVTWSKEQGISMKILKMLNPWINGKSLPISTNKSYELLIPKNAEQLSIFKG